MLRIRKIADKIGLSFLRVKYALLRKGARVVCVCGEQRVSYVKKVIQYYLPKSDFSRIVYTARASLYERMTAPLVVVFDKGGFSRLKTLFAGIYIDPQTDEKAAWGLCDIARITFSASSQHCKAHKSVGVIVKKVREQNRSCVYVFGTGPSLGLASGCSFHDGYRVVCNTIVKSAQTWNQLKPDIIVAGDALYHFSHVDHARRFRSDLNLRMSEWPAYFVYPERFHPLVRNTVDSKFRDYLVPAATNKRVRFHDCGSYRWELPFGLGNALGSLLLPIACGLSKDIRLLGFDGRAPCDRGFWSNSNEHAYLEEIERMKSEFPGFYERSVPVTDPNRYIRKVHGDKFEEALIDAEKSGFQFRFLTKSYTAIFAERYDKCLLEGMSGNE